MKYLSGIETRDNILKVSKALFFKTGFKDTSIRKIASKANLTSGALYKHFSSKEDILDAIVGPYVDDWWKQCDKLLDRFEFDLLKAKTMADIKKLIARDEAKWIYSYIKKNSDVWKFIFFNSTGTKYQHFFDEFIQYETNITLKILNKIDPEKKYLEVISDTEIYFIIKGFYSMGLSVYDDEFDDDKRVNFFSILGTMYKPFWERLFSINF